MSRRWSWTLAVAVLVTGALALRSFALDFGLPAVYNPDEVAIMSRALAFAKGDLNPHNFLYPTFFFYALFAWIGGYFVLARLTGSVSSLSAFQHRFFTDPSSVYLAGRALGAASGAMTTGVTALVGRTVFDVPTGLVAGTLLAVAPLAVIDSHYVKHDVAATLAIMLAMWRLARCWPEGGAAARVSAFDLALASLACGVAWSIHYYCVFLAVPLAVTAIDARRVDGWPAAATSLASCWLTALVAFFMLSPFLLVEPATAWRDIVANREIVVDRATNLGLVANLHRYVTLLVEGVTLPVVALSVIGAITLAVTDRRRALLLFSFPVPFLLFIGNTVPASRYLNPLAPFVVLMAALAIRRLAAVMATRHQPLVTAALTVLAGVGALLASARAVTLFAQDDTRTLAARLIDSHAPDGATVLIQPYSVQLTQSRESLEESLRARLGSLERLPARARLRLAVSPWPRPSYRLLWLGDGGLDEDKIYLRYADLGDEPLSTLRSWRVQYVVLKRYTVADPAVIPLAEALARGARRLGSISPYREDGSADVAAVAPFLHNTDSIIDPALARPGPIVDVFEIP